MKIGEINLEYANLSDEELISKIPSHLITPLGGQIASFYDSRLDIPLIYSMYGYEMRDKESQQQVHCLLPSHGTEDRHPSARYYPQDRNTGEVRQAVYCHKCQKTHTAFWLLYAIESSRTGMHMREFYAFLKRVFKIPFPRHVFLSFDPQEFFVFTETETRGKRQRLVYSETLLKMKEVGDPIYLAEMNKFWKEM